MAPKVQTSVNTTFKEKEGNNIIDTILSELTDSFIEKKAIVFCGAGISFNSGLPLANDLINCVLNKIGLSNKEILSIMNSGFPFEAFLEELIGWSDISKIFEIFADGEPNTNHLILANLAKKRYIRTVCTTNFDTLIEKAFESLGLVRSKDYVVLYKDSDLKNINWYDNRIRIVKIHGSIEDKKSLAATIHGITARELSKTRMEIIDYLFSKGDHDRVLIVGYSCSDIFDISPQIEMIKTNHKKVVLIQHSYDKKTARELENENNIFRNYSGSNLIEYDTEQFLYLLWDKISTDNNYIKTGSKINAVIWPNRVNEWYLENEGITYGIKYSIAASVFMEIADTSNAIKYFKKALVLAKNIKNKNDENKCLHNLGLIYTSIGKYNEAIEYLDENIISIVQYENNIIIRNNYGELGNIYALRGNYIKAEEYLNKALLISEETKDLEGISKWLCSLGNVYLARFNFSKAIECQVKAIKIAQEIGDKYQEGLCFGNLGICYVRKGDILKAIGCLEKGIQISEQMGEREHRALWLSHLGSIYLKNAEYVKAINYYGKALRIAEEDGRLSAVADCCGNMGNVYLILADINKAKQNFQRAYRIAKKINDKNGQGYWLGGLGNVMAYLGKYSVAKTFLYNALRIAQETDNKENEGRWLGNIAIILSIERNNKKAEEYMERAISILKPICGDDDHSVRLFERKLVEIKNE